MTENVALISKTKASKRCQKAEFIHGEHPALGSELSTCTMTVIKLRLILSGVSPACYLES